MKLVSSRNPLTVASWKEAVLQGLAPDGGLYVPQSLPRITAQQLTQYRGLPLPRLARELALSFIGDEVSEDTITSICTDSFTFDAPLVQLDSSTFVLELFHGPTCAFKDFGARFMARLFRYFWGTRSLPLTVLVATSGDTGGAVANAFFDPTPNPPIRVAILFPQGKVSDVQRKQMTTLGHNVTAFEVQGTFDDCQALVKKVLQDPSTRNGEQAFTSANSINIARLLPQMFYYAHAALRCDGDAAPVFVVPSGNLGNITGALMAHECGFPVAHCIAACNANRTFPDFLASGSFTPRASLETISNAMDVGAPSNFVRINYLMGHSNESSNNWRSSPLSHKLSGLSISEQETRAAMKEFHAAFRYVLDPHTAVGAAALSTWRKQNPGFSGPCILVSTAHPAKFSNVVEETIELLPDMPPQLKAAHNLPEQVIGISTSYAELLQHLQNLGKA